MQQGKRSFCFFPLFLPPSHPPPTCSVKAKTGRHLHLLMMRKQRGRVLQATPSLDISPCAVTRWSGGLTPHVNDGTGQGRSRSPCPYKYCPNAEEKGGPKERVFKRERRRQQQLPPAVTEEKPKQNREGERTRERAETDRKESAEEGRPPSSSAKPSSAPPARPLCLYTKRRRTTAEESPPIATHRERPP
uniref:Uncharacterized protein n=1 Tax=Populus trichocarpa TaxID=3694 RepID=B9MZZ5_POPTR